MSLKTIQKIFAILIILIVPILYNSCGEPRHDMGSAELNSIGTSEGSIAIFSATLHPVLVQNCGAYHGAGQSPQFALSDAAQSHLTVINAGLVSFTSPVSSRLVQKILQGHSGISPTIGTPIETQVTAWAAQLAATGDTPPPVEPLQPTFKSISDRILIPKCVGCHGATRADSGKRYDTYTNTMRGVNTLQPAQSQLYTIVRSGEMPTRPAPALSNEEVAIILEWITLGAPNN